MDEKREKIMEKYECRNQDPNHNGCRGRHKSGRRKFSRLSPYKAGVQADYTCCQCEYIWEPCSMVYQTLKGNLPEGSGCYKKCQDWLKTQKIPKSIEDRDLYVEEHFD
ncbi:MAG: hypothetical protein ACTSRW_04145 [Candidatus Helarchaeota archaeon]